MISSMKRLWRDRRGNALVLAGAALPLLVGSAGLATDTIQWALWKRQLQRAADSAALAGVYAKVQANSQQSPEQSVTADLGKNNNTKANMLSGYPQVTFPTSTGWTNGVKVTLAAQKSLSFSSMFLSNPPVIQAEATAATIATGVYCVVSLVRLSSTGITATGNSKIDLGCGMITNSTSLTAAIATGSSKVYATPIAAVGSIKKSDNWGTAELLPFTVAQEDPYASVEPDTTGCPGSALKVNSNETATISPGCYSKIDLDGTVTMQDGTYIIDGGNLSIGAQAKVTCNSCTFVLTNSSSGTTATIGMADVNGGAQVNLKAPDSGKYKGLLFYQDRRASSSNGNVNKINGNSDSLMEGAFYFPNQKLDVNGTANLKFKCAKFVAYIVEFSGNGGITNTCSGYGDGAIMGKHVRLVA
jgi:Flp pilus assembly protein TadG